MHADDLLLVPKPRHAMLHGDGPEVDTVADEHRVSTLPAEGYELEIAPDNITIHHRDDQGLRYARATLGQLRDQSTA